MKKINDLGKLVLLIGGKQLIVQIVGLLAGLIVVRLLSVQEYAWFTIANTFLGALIVLSDGGISSGVMAEAGKDWQSKIIVGKALATGMQLRRKFAFYCFIAISPVLFYLLKENEAMWWQIAIITAALIPAFYAALSDTLLEIPLKLHQDINVLQNNQFFAAIARLILTSISLTMLPFTAIAIAANGLPRIWANIRLRKILRLYALPIEVADSEIRQRILKIVKRTLPGAIYFVLSGQINIWIITFFGNTSAIAQIGALGRITVAFNVLSSLSNIIIVPRFARLPSVRDSVQKRFFQIQVACFMVCLFIYAIASFVPGELLLILGGFYSGLETELLLNIIVSLVGLMTGLSYKLIISRGWVINPLIGIPLVILTTIISSVVFDLSTLRGVLKFSIIQGIAGYLLQTIYGVIKIHKISTKNA